MTLKQLEAKRTARLKAEVWSHKQWLRWHQTHDMVKRQEAYDRWVREQRLRIDVDKMIAAAKRRPVHTGAAGVALIASFEGGNEFSRDGKSFPPYWDDIGKLWTIGRGHTAGDGAPIPGPHTRPLTFPEADALLLHDLGHRGYEKAVREAAARCKLQLTQNEFDALVSLVFNCGVGVLDPGRTMGNALLSGGRGEIAQAFMVYVKGADGSNPPGLRRRRKAERALFLKP